MERHVVEAWQAILNKGGLVGGEIEFLEGEPDGEIYHGPIEEIRLVKSGVFVKLSWVAQLGLDGESNEEWILAPWADSFLLITTPPEKCGQTIQFALPRGSGWICPIGTEQIPRSEIRRLAA